MASIFHKHRQDHKASEENSCQKQQNKKRSIFIGNLPVEKKPIESVGSEHRLPGGHKMKTGCLVPVFLMSSEIPGKFLLHLAMFNPCNIAWIWHGV